MNPLLVTHDAIRDADGRAWARVASANLLATEPREVVEGLGGATRLVVRSGWTQSAADEPVISWGSPSRGKFDEAIEALMPLLASRGVTLLVHPRAGDVLSDIPSTLTFLRKWSAEPVGLLLEPAALLAPSMLARADEHLQRIGESLGEHAATAAIVVSNVREDSADPRVLAACPMHRGLIDPSLLAEFARAAAAAGKPVALLNDEVETQLRFIAGD